MSASHGEGFIGFVVFSKVVVNESGGSSFGSLALYILLQHRHLVRVVFEISFF